MPTASTRTLTLELDEHTAALAAEALRGDADRRRRAGQTFSAELMAKKRDDGIDIRSGALHVVNSLAEADALAAAADQLATAWEAADPTVPRRPVPPRAGEEDDDDEPDGDLEQRIADAEALAANGGDDGATVIEHGDDPDVEEARRILAGAGPVASAAPTLPTS